MIGDSVVCHFNPKPMLLRGRLYASDVEVYEGSVDRTRGKVHEHTQSVAFAVALSDWTRTEIHNLDAKDAGILKTAVDAIVGAAMWNKIHDSEEHEKQEEFQPRHALRPAKEGEDAGDISWLKWSPLTLGKLVRSEVDGASSVERDCRLAEQATGVPWSRFYRMDAGDYWRLRDFLDSKKKIQESGDMSLKIFNALKREKESGSDTDSSSPSSSPEEPEASPKSSE